MRLRHTGTHTPAPQAALRRGAPHNPRALADAAHDLQRAAGLSWPAEAQDLQEFHGLQGLQGLQGFQGEQPPSPPQEDGGFARRLSLVSHMWLLGAFVHACGQAGGSAAGVPAGSEQQQQQQARMLTYAGVC
jgi:hypothetical protein